MSAREVLYALNPIACTWRPAPEDGYPVRQNVRLATLVDEIGWERAEAEHPEVHRLLSAVPQ